MEITGLTLNTLGYTHYFSEQEKGINKEIADIANQLYKGLLANIYIEQDNTRSLLNIWTQYQVDESNEDEFDAVFHEWTRDTLTKDPIVYDPSSPEKWGFCKTAHKPYDIAVYAVLHTVYLATGIKFSYDGDLDPSTSLKTYIDTEMSEDKSIYQLEKLVELCDQAHQKIEKSLDGKPYIRISDISDDDMEYIVTKLKDGCSTIYLNNGTAIQLTII